MSTLHEKLAARPAPPRGEAIRAKIEALHAKAEGAAYANLSVKATAAAEHNLKVAAVATGSKWAEKLVFAERKMNVENDLSAHEVRAAKQVIAKAAKASAEKKVGDPRGK